jgi:circadian clock protein KaiB
VESCAGNGGSSLVASGGRRGLSAGQIRKTLMTMRATMTRTGGNTDDEAQPAAPAEETWELQLCVTGRTAKCVRAIANLQRACAHWLPGRYHIEIIDLLENPRRAAEDQIVAVPTLVRSYPPPVCKIVGDLSDPERLLFGMQLRPGPVRLTDERG